MSYLSLMTEVRKQRVHLWSKLGDSLEGSWFSAQVRRSSRHLRESGLRSHFLSEPRPDQAAGTLDHEDAVAAPL